MFSRWKNMVNSFLFSQIQRLVEFFVKFSRRFIFAIGFYRYFSQSFIFAKEAKITNLKQKLTSQISNLLKVDSLIFVDFFVVHSFLCRSNSVYYFSLKAAERILKSLLSFNQGAYIKYVGGGAGRFYKFFKKSFAASKNIDLNI